MAKARLEKASLDDEIAKLKAKNDKLSQTNGELEAKTDEFECPLHSAALRERRTLLWLCRRRWCRPVWIRSDSVRTDTATHAVRNISRL